MMDTPYITNKSLVQGKIAAMQSWWAEKVHVLADFDRTLTKWFYEGKPISSIASFLYEDKWDYLPVAYQQAGKALFDHYYPIEQDPSIDPIAKKQAMDERWAKHLDILIQYKISKKILADIAQHKELQLRDACEQFFTLLRQHHIPLIIMSASGIGYDAIDAFFHYKKINQSNISIISNAFIRDTNGYAIGRKEPVIHSMNKSETTIAQFPDIYEKIHDRTNVLLLGDSLHDLEMVDGFVYDTMLSIGFCHSDKKEVRDLFMQTYDVVIFNDGDMQYPIEILKQILQ